MEEEAVGRGGIGSVGGGWAAIDITSEEGTKTWEECIMLTSLSLCLSISDLTALSSAIKDWTCCCKEEIAPMLP